jgi:hypothetical protein
LYVLTRISAWCGVFLVSSVPLSDIYSISCHSTKYCVFRLLSLLATLVQIQYNNSQSPLEYPLCCVPLLPHVSSIAGHIRPILYVSLPLLAFATREHQTHRIRISTKVVQAWRRIRNGCMPLTDRVNTATPQGVLQIRKSTPQSNLCITLRPTRVLNRVEAFFPCMGTKMIHGKQIWSVTREAMSLLTETDRSNTTSNTVSRYHQSRCETRHAQILQPSLQPHTFYVASKVSSLRRRHAKADSSILCAVA